MHRRVDRPLATLAALVVGASAALIPSVAAAATANGTKIILWVCNGQTNQQWSLRG